MAERQEAEKIVRDWIEVHYDSRKCQRYPIESIPVWSVIDILEMEIKKRKCRKPEETL